MAIDDEPIKPVQRVEAAIVVSEITSTDKDWRKNIEKLATDFRDVLNETNKEKQGSGLKDFMSEATEGYFEEPNELVSVVEENPGNEQLLFLRERVAQSVALALATGDDKQSQAVVSGSEQTIQSVLPPEMTSIARDVAAVIVPEGVVVLITKLDNSFTGGGRRNRADFKAINITIEEIDDFRKSNNIGRNHQQFEVVAGIAERLQGKADEIDLVLNPKALAVEPVQTPEPAIDDDTKELLRTIAGNTAKPAVVNAPPIVAPSNPMMDKYYKRAEDAAQIDEITSYGEWWALIDKKEQLIAVPKGKEWVLYPPSWFGGNSVEWYNFLDKVTTASNNVVKRLNAMNGAEGKWATAYNNTGYPKLTEGEVGKLLEDDKYKFEQVMGVIMQGFVEALPNGDGNMVALGRADMAAGKKGYWVYKKDVIGAGSDDPGINILTDVNKGFPGYREYISNKLIACGISSNKQEAEMLTLLAWDTWSLGGINVGPDHGRWRVGSDHEGARTCSDPFAKFRKKSESEVFTGSWPDYWRVKFAGELELKMKEAKRRKGASWVDDDEKAVKAEFFVSKAREQGMLPAILCGSVFDTEVKIKNAIGGEETTTWGRALSKGRQFVLANNSPRNILKDYNSWLEAAAGMWGCIAGDIKLDVKSLNKELNSITAGFGKGLNNNYLEIKKWTKWMGDDVTNLLIAALGGATGIVPAHIPLLDIPYQIDAKYVTVCNRILEPMTMLTEREKKELVNYYAMDKKRSNAIIFLWSELQGMGKDVSLVMKPRKAAYEAAIYKGNDVGVPLITKLL
ncbi:MAG: hypothetical protein WC069_05625 [Candidatus Shapirobacteria bacterium]